MTRYHQFNSMYPQEAKKISDGYEDMGIVIWNAFAKATWLHKFFDFKIEMNKPDATAKSEGIEADTK